MRATLARTFVLAACFVALLGVRAVNGDAAEHVSISFARAEFQASGAAQDPNPPILFVVRRKTRVLRHL